MIIRMPYEEYRGKRVRKQFSFSKPTMTEQHHKQACDVNNILKSYDRTGLLTHVRASQGSFEDVSGVPSYQDSLNRVIAAQNAFEALPSKIRKRFSNNPQEFVEFCSNPDNADEIKALGLVELASSPEPLLVRVENPPEPPTDPAE